MKTLLTVLIISQLLMPMGHSVNTSNELNSFRSGKYTVYGNIEGDRAYPFITKITSWDEFNLYRQKEIDQFGIQPSLFTDTKYDQAFFTDSFLVVYHYGGSGSDQFDITSISPNGQDLEIAICFTYSSEDDYGEIQIVIELDQALSDKEIRIHNSSQT